MRAKFFDRGPTKTITLLAILLFFTAFSGEFGCRRQAVVSQTYDFRYLEGTFARRIKKVIVINSDDGQTVNFRVGRRTVFTPKEWPSIGDRLKVKYHTQVLSHAAIGNYYIAHEVTKTGYAPEVSPQVVTSAPAPAPAPFPSPYRQEEQGEIPVVERAKIAILEFQGLNEEAKKDNMGKMVTEIMTTSLVNTQAFDIIEREKLNKVLKEYQLTMTGVVDTTSAKEIGKILGADAIVTGSVMMLRNRLRLDARVIDVATGAIMAAESSLGEVDIQSLGTMCDTITSKIVKKYYANAPKSTSS